MILNGVQTVPGLSTVAVRSKGELFYLVFDGFGAQPPFDSSRRASLEATAPISCVSYRLR